MALGFLSQEDCHRRLNRTVCLYDGKPVYVEVDRGMDLNTVLMYPLPISGKSLKKIVTVTEDAFDYGAFELGYMNWYDQPWYLSRAPERKNNQGLMRENVWGASVQGEQLAGSNWFHAQCFVDCVLGQYPKKEEIMDQVNALVLDGAAIARHVAIVRLHQSNQVGLYYRNRLVGLKNQFDNHFYLLESKERSFMERILNKAGVEL